MKIFGKDIHRSLSVAAALAVTAFAALAFTAPAQARDSFAFGYSDGRSGFNLGVSDYRGRDRYDRYDRGDRRDYRRHRHHGHRHYAPQRYRYVVAPPPYYYAPPRPYYDYGY